MSMNNWIDVKISTTLNDFVHELIRANDHNIIEKQTQFEM